MPQLQRLDCPAGLLEAREQSSIFRGPAVQVQLNRMSLGEFLVVCIRVAGLDSSIAQAQVVFSRFMMPVRQLYQSSVQLTNAPMTDEEALHTVVRGGLMDSCVESMVNQ